MRCTAFAAALALAAMAAGAAEPPRRTGRPVEQPVTPSPDVAIRTAEALLKDGKYREAADLLRAVILASPESARIWKDLGAAEYALGQLEKAIAAWSESERLSQDPEVTRLLQKARRDEAAEGDFVEKTSLNFTLKWKGKSLPASFGPELLGSLEQARRDLERRLGFSPDEPVLVILYGDRAFSEVTRAPAWSGGVYDGRIRLPVEGLTGVTPSLAISARHELVHAFVTSRSRGRCPAWLQEGLAQVLSGEPDQGSAAVAQTEIGRGVSLARLQAPFSGLPAEVAARACLLSRAAVEVLRDRYGLSGIVRLLDRLAEGDAPAAALESALSLTYPKLDEEILAWAATRRNPSGGLVSGDAVERR